MELLGLFLAFSALFIGVLRYNKLWLGTLVGIALFIGLKLFGNDSFDYSKPLINAGIITFELLLLIFGAYLFYNTLSRQNHFEPFIEQAKKIPLKLDLLLIFAFYFGSFLEGIAGFGIPAMLIAPLLFSFGFRPLTCVVIPLVANTIPVLFGALGTPILIGLNFDGNFEIILYTLTINLLPLILLPFALAFLFSKTELQTLNWKKLWKKLLGAGFLYAIPFVTTALFNVEFPSVVAGLVGLILFSIFFIPKAIQPRLELWFSTFQPYLLFIGVLLLTRFGLRDVTYEIVAGAKKISLYQPGLVFIGISFIIIQVKSTEAQSRLNATLLHFKSTWNGLKKTSVAIGSLVLLTQLTQVDIISSTESLLAIAPAGFVAPLLGIAGSFTTGSATMSNLLFAPIFTESALFLALLHTGSAIGNAISLQNILMVNAVIERPEALVEILKKTVLWVLTYFLIVISIVQFLNLLLQ